MAGRPPKYKTAKELQNKIDEYFNTDEGKEKPTISGLAYFLGYTSRQALYDMQKGPLSYTIKANILKIESKHEQGLYGNSNAGHIFWLKNRGWTDTQNVNQNTNITIKDDTETGLP